MKKRSRWDFNTPEGLNDIQMSKGSAEFINEEEKKHYNCLLYTSPSPRDRQKSRMPSSA